MPSNNLPESRHLATIDAVCYWLGYQFKIGRSQLIHEASLRYPIADTLTAHSIGINRIALEKSHPIFKSRKIDLVIKNNSFVNDDAKSIKEVYEFKLAKYVTSILHGEEHQRVFDDIVRLAYFNLWEKKDCFFLMCGTYEDFLTYFVSQPDSRTSDQSQKNTVSHKPRTYQDQWSPKGFYKEWFAFENNKSTKNTFENSNTKFGLKIFQENYKLRELKYHFSNSINITTTCMAISPCNSANRTHAAGIWKIEGSEASTQ